MTTTRIFIVLGTFWWVTQTLPVKAASPCSDLDGKDSATRLEYLRGDRSKLSPKCIVETLKYLGGKRYAPASAVLIQYLDYRDPSPMPSWTPLPKAYPAVDALYVLGKSVVPELAAVIARSDTSASVRRNASETIFLIYGVDNPEAVAVLVTAAHAQTDPAASIRLMDEARRLAASCRITAQNACQNAALK